MRWESSAGEGDAAESLSSLKGYRTGGQQDQRLDRATTAPTPLGGFRLRLRSTPGRRTTALDRVGTREAHLSLSLSGACRPATQPRAPLGRFMVGWKGDTSAQNAQAQPLVLPERGLLRADAKEAGHQKTSCLGGSKVPKGKRGSCVCVTSSQQSENTISPAGASFKVPFTLGREQASLVGVGGTGLRMLSPSSVMGVLQFVGRFCTTRKSTKMANFRLHRGWGRGMWRLVAVGAVGTEVMV